jgi:hypothetical protein
MHHSNVVRKKKKKKHKHYLECCTPHYMRDNTQYTQETCLLFSHSYQIKKKKKGGLLPLIRLKP